MIQSMSFNKGLRQVKYGDIENIKKDICDALHIKSRQAYANRREGRVSHTVIEAYEIEQIFKKYGVEEPWGE